MGGRRVVVFGWVASGALALECTLPGWPGVSPTWHHGGASELCFCAYSIFPTSPSNLDELCPSWRRYVSLDGRVAGKLHRQGEAMVAGVGGAGNASRRVYGAMTDWSVDLGSGMGRQCNTTLTPTCVSEGAHILSMPGARYVSQALGANDPSSLETLLSTGEAAYVVTVLADMIRGGLRFLGHGNLPPKSCRDVNEDPTAENDCLAQCFHQAPDVRYVHLHTTARVKAMIDGPVDSGLGPDANLSEAKTTYPTNGEYNLCACEPPDWAYDGRGFCPMDDRGRPLEPSAPEYVDRAALALCRNLAGAAHLSPTLCAPPQFPPRASEVP